MSSNFTIALIKSPSVGRGHALPIISRITQSGFVVSALQIKTLCPTTIRAFYCEHVGKEYYGSLMKSVSEDVVALVLTRHDDKDVVAEWRALMGATNAATAAAGTIRHFFGGFNWRGKESPISDNAVHGSDSDKAALYEYSVLFDGYMWPKDPSEFTSHKE